MYSYQDIFLKKEFLPFPAVFSQHVQGRNKKANNFGFFFLFTVKTNTAFNSLASSVKKYHSVISVRPKGMLVELWTSLELSSNQCHLMFSVAVTLLPFEIYSAVLQWTKGQYSILLKSVLYVTKLSSDNTVL